jgi:hypothetical protein
MQVVNGSPQLPTRTDCIEAVQFGQQQKQPTGFFGTCGLLNFFPAGDARPDNASRSAGPQIRISRSIA